MRNPEHGMNRRRFIAAMSAIGLGMGLSGYGQRLGAAETGVIKKAIPSTGEMLTAIGMGSSRTFDVTPGSAHAAQRLEVLQAFFDHEGQVIDSSPMYGNAESVLGELLAKVNNKQDMFAATKVWTPGRDLGIEQMQRSMRRMGVEVFDLMQIHNLVDWETHVETLKQWKQQGKVRYIGITTSHGRFHKQLIEILKTQPFDFVQFTYNISNRNADESLLPLAQERGIATLINRPYDGGDLFAKVKGKPLPPWAADYNITSWGQYFLKFIISHPGVTCAIPATSKVSHMIDNMGAAFGPLPDESGRKRMRRYLKEL